MIVADLSHALLHPRRYLVDFDPRDVPHRFTDVLVLGSGLAGLRAALGVSPEYRVEVVTKAKEEQSNSQWAQGGIAAVWDVEDTFAAHVDDTLDAGKGLCDESVVEMVVREAPTHIRELMSWGARFDTEAGEVSLGREGGHTFSRILHARGDATGQEVMRVMIARATSQPNVRIRENTFTIDLLTLDGRCTGALVWSPEVGLHAIWAQQTVLATGGCGQLFRETTNPSMATGDGIAAAFRAGAVMQDMEFVQFHPTVLYVAGTARSLISEAVRGEGAYLRDRNGFRFMPDQHPLAELAPRDAVSQAIVRQMAKTQHPCVYLDQSHLDPDAVRRRFPSIVAACAQAGLDFARDPIPVRPGAHYMVGGVATDEEGRTSLPGLWAAGEVAATGLHGANRLASNSLLEAMVFGNRCGQGANAKLAPRRETVLPLDKFAHQPRRPLDEAPLDLADVRNSLRSLMFRNVGIERNAEELSAALEQIAFWSHYVLDKSFERVEGWELQNMLTAAALIASAALERRESRGTHLREDFPATDDTEWRVHLQAQNGREGFTCKPVDVSRSAGSAT
jgi:L-aspartate oxidase